MRLSSFLFATSILIAALPPPSFGAADGAALDRSAPEAWNLWRCGPFPFPDTMEPQVPEAVAGAAIEFGRQGADLTIVVPPAKDDYDGRALQAMVRLIREKVPRAGVVVGSELGPAHRKSHLLVLGTAVENAFARTVLGQDADSYLAGIRAGGYRLGTRNSPFDSARKVILALGVDPAGAWAAAGVLAFGIHPNQERLSPLKPWPVALPEGIYWSPFEARCSPAPAEPRPEPAVAPTRPRIPFGVRIWGSPMPTLASFQRLVRALRTLGINTIAIQGGGWPDRPDAAELYRGAVDLAWREGIFSILYVGNEMAAHRPAALTAAHRAVVDATKDQPGLLEWHLYNQLSADLSAGERDMVAEQMRWLRGTVTQPVGVEVVWGHDTAKIPADKVRLIEDLKAWGMNVVAHDDAPIGGWSKHHNLAIWEPRLRELAHFDLPMEAVIQAHVPFVEPTVPSAVEVRNQFWWAAAGGARGFLFEAAYLFTHLSMRGLLSWDLRPLPDGRAAEIRRLAAVVQAMTPVLADAPPQPQAELEALGLAFERETPVVMRLRRAPTGERYLLLVNSSTDRAGSATVVMRNTHFHARELTPGNALRATTPDKLTVELAPGDGACVLLLAP